MSRILVTCNCDLCPETGRTPSTPIRPHTRQPDHHPHVSSGCIAGARMFVAEKLAKRLGYSGEATKEQRSKPVVLDEILTSI